MRLGETPGCLQLRASSRLIGSAAAPATHAASAALESLARRAGSSGK